MRASKSNDPKHERKHLMAQSKKFLVTKLFQLYGQVDELMELRGKESKKRAADQRDIEGEAKELKEDREVWKGRATFLAGQLRDFSIKCLDLDTAVLLRDKAERECTAAEFLVNEMAQRCRQSHEYDTPVNLELSHDDVNKWTPHT
jgi:FtsZ-binding cell division protein ZapB